ncbi:hypothetical protein AT728_37670 [Streptomyces silvensis]|uniref:Uncharacterized protein n=1 Tax=Streptomyces silvensis TaxID=1765722 RepID=A0A0W7WR70_9ACTN|nr:hypothetical protein AT728_37670 [Streptomyces silvensis]
MQSGARVNGDGQSVERTDGAMAPVRDIPALGPQELVTWRPPGGFVDIAHADMKGVADALGGLL